MKRLCVLTASSLVVFGLLTSFASGYYYRNVYFFLYTSGQGFSGGYIAFGFPFVWRTVYFNGTFGEATIEHYDYNPTCFLLDAALLSLIVSPPILIPLYSRRKGMFKGEKTRMFWVGLTILGLASTVLFSIIWYFHRNWMYQVPPIVGSIVFMLIGLYMMKSGVQEEKVNDRLQSSENKIAKDQSEENELRWH
jgi:hypothetical protein